jgi:N-acetylneuraminic acid mutarotase
VDSRTPNLCTLRGLSAAILIASAAGAGSTARAQEGESWIVDQALAMPEALTGIGAAKDLLGRIYIPGGGMAVEGGSAIGKAVLRFDESSGSWERLADLQVARVDSAVAADGLGRLYAIGGYNEAGTLSSVERYDPEEGLWTFVRDLPEPRLLANAVTGPSGDVIVLGGTIDEGVTGERSVLRYDAGRDAWIEEPPMIHPRILFGAAVGRGGAIYAVGGAADGFSTGSETSGTVERYDPATRSWSLVAPLTSHPHQLGFAAADACGLIYAGGGWDPGYNGLVERYDPDADAWSPYPSLDQGRNNMAAVLADSGRIYLFGGDSGFTHQSFVAYTAGCGKPCEGGEGRWEPRAPMPTPRQETCAAAVDGIVYVFGDYCSSGLNAVVEAYDPKTDSWSRKTDMPTGRGEAAAAVADGVIFVIGGNNCYSNCWLAANEAYDPRTDAWTSRAPMPTRRGWLTATAVKGKIYAMGGADSYASPAYFDRVEVYDPSADSWSEGTPMPRRRCHHAAAELGGKIYLFGGVQDLPSIVHDAVDVYDPEADRWTEVAPFPEPRWHLAGAAAGGRIFAIRGADDSGILPAVEEYDPLLDRWRGMAPLSTARFWFSAVGDAGLVHVFGGSGSPAGRESIASTETFAPPCAGAFPTAVLLFEGEEGCVKVVLEATVAVAAGEFAIEYDPASTWPYLVEPTGDLAAIRGGAGPEFFASPETPAPGRPIAWVNSYDDPIAHAFDPGRHELFRICFPRLPGNKGADCSPLKFIAGVSVGGGPPVELVLSTPDGREVIPETRAGCVRPAARFRRCDVNGSGNWNITDAILMFLCQFNTSAASIDCAGCPDARDCNDDETIDLSDAIFFLSWKFLGARTLPEPVTSCAMDLTGEGLGCADPGEFCR